MQVKIECQCETRFAFDVEPINGAMPVTVNCPGCGADKTEDANVNIRRQLATPAPVHPAPHAPRQPIRIAAAAPVPAPPPPSAPVTTAGESSTGEPASETPIVRCPKHAQEPAVDHCFVCHKPICLKCMEQFGYLCSVYCQSQAERRNLQVPVYAGKKFLVQAKEWRKAKLVVAGIAAVVALLLGFYGWYVFAGSKPRTLFSLQLSRSDRPIQSQLLSAKEMILLRGNKLSLLHAGNGKELWSITLAAAKPAATTRPSALSDDFAPASTKFFVIADDVWVSLADRIIRLDQKTGKQKLEVPIKGTLRDVKFAESSILAIAEGEPGQRSITHIHLPAGTVKTDTVIDPAPVRRAVPLRAVAQRDDDDGADLEMSIDPNLDAREFVPAGANVARVQVRLLERRMVAVQAMKAAPAESTANSGRLTARDSMKAATEMLNEMQRERTGGVSYENESRYQVHLRRLAPPDSPEWSGEVVGPPMFYAQKTVDILVAGKAVHVFSKKNQKLWEGKLSHPVSEKVAASYGSDSEIPPCLEEAGSLYVFDKGVLAAFDARSGNVRWRVPSVGISQVVRDSRGMLYVATTSASPESIQFTQQIKFTDKDYPVILKVDASSGKVLWRAEKMGDHCYVSGPYVYVTESRVSGLDIIRTGGEDTPTHHRIYRVDTDNGEYHWYYYQPKAPRSLNVFKNRLLLQYNDEVRVLSYLSM